MATYTYKFTEIYGSYINLISDRDLENEVFEIGDVINLTGNIYNAGKNGGSTFTALRAYFEKEYRVTQTMGSIGINAPINKTTSFSRTPISIVIDPYTCSSNTTVGNNAIVKLTFIADSTSTSQSFEFINNGIKIKIKDPTVAPVYAINENDFVEAVDYKGRFGAFVQAVSQATISIPVSNIDTGTGNNLSGSVTSASLSVIAPDGSEVYANTIKNPKSTSILEYELGGFNESGMYTCTLTLTGRYGKTGTYSTTFTVLPYTMPKLFINGTNPIAKRFRTEQDDIGGTVYTEAPDGTKALLSFVGNIQAFSGLNTYEISVKYGIENEEMIDLGVIASGTDVDDLAFTYQDTIELLKDDTFSIDNRYQFDITIKDYFGQSATITGYLEKAVFRFRVHENGVAVGMNTTGTAEQKKFEVAENYTTHLYGETFAHGGISGVTNYPVMNEGAVYPPTNNNEEVYEREELTGGTWIDGKPIYRYTWMGVSSRSGSQGSYGNIPGGNPETVIRLYGTFKRPSDNAWFAMPNIYYGSLNYAANMRTNEDGGLTVGFGSAYDGTKSMILVVEYTKK